MSLADSQSQFTLEDRIFIATGIEPWLDNLKMGKSWAFIMY